VFHADGQTDMTKLIVASRKFANAPNNISNGFAQAQKHADETVLFHLLGTGEKMTQRKRLRRSR
jgi:hypothetical protein